MSDILYKINSLTEDSEKEKKSLDINIINNKLITI